MLSDVNTVRKDFPILSQKVNNKPLIYFDNAATTQKPQAMIDELVNYYSTYNSNIHRGVHTLSQKATDAYENTRKLISKIYGCKETEVIFTKNDTESLNLLSHSLGDLFEDIGNIVLSDLEHHSNIVPWQILEKRKKQKEERKEESSTIRYVRFNELGLLDVEDLKRKVDKETKIVSLNWCSNTFGIINPIEEIIEIIREINPKAFIIVDAAQAVPHKKFDFGSLGADFVTFSAHKLCGPTGVGVLIGKENLLNNMPPFLAGGDMIKEVDWNSTTYNDLPYKFEAGTPNIADVIAFGKSLKYLESLGFDNIFERERVLADYLITALNKLDFVEIYGEKNIGNKDKISLVSFNIKGVHPHDVGTILDEDGIAVRTGHHCTQLIMKRLQIPASVRASLYFYNTEEEIDKMIVSLQKAYNLFNL